VAVLSVAAAVACLVFAVQLSASERHSSLISVLGINLGFFAELRAGQYAPGFPTGGDVQWLNSEPLDMKTMQAEGDWVLIHFWDSTSVESLRTLPAVKKMHEYYGTQGLRVIGVHRPRYDFARSLPLVADAVQRLKIDYPVVNDVDADVAHAYGAQKLDTIFLVNNDNKIVGRKSGREASAEMLSVICQSLSSKNPSLACLPNAPSPALKGTEAAAADSKDGVLQGLYVHHYGNPNFGTRCRAATSDVFVGEARGSDLEVGKSHGRGSLSAQQSYGALLQRSSYTDLAGVTLHDGAFVLSGDWTTHKEGMVATADPVTGFTNTHLRLRYHGKAVYALMGLEAAEAGGGDMCADGVQGNAAAGTPCLAASACQDVAGSFGRYGWCYSRANAAHTAPTALIGELKTLTRRLDTTAHAESQPAQGTKPSATAGKTATGARVASNKAVKTSLELSSRESATAEAPTEWGACTPCKPMEAVKVYLLVDGVPVPHALRGKDVVQDAFGRTYVLVLEPRIYFLISDTYAASRGLELLPAKEGVAFNQMSFASNCASDLPPLS